MTTQIATAIPIDAPGQLRKMRLDEFDRFVEFIETAFAEDQAREGRNFRDEIQDLRRLLPLLKTLFAIWPRLEAYFYTLVWDAGECFAAAVTISRQGTDAHRWYIANVATHPHYRGRGLARTLVNAALDRIRLQGGHYAVLDVRADNEPAYRLYRSLGFLHLESSTTLKGIAHPLALPALPNAYVLRPLPAAEWRTPFMLTRRLASAATRSVCPPTTKQFQTSWIGRSLQALLDRAQHVKTQRWALAAAAQPIGLVTCHARSSGSNPHRAAIEIDPEHVNIAPQALALAINFCAAQRAGAAHPMLIDLNGQPPDPIAYLHTVGFMPIETTHQLGMTVS